ncbi:hypothetical protein B9W73_02680 [Lactococcus lactis]|uniref:phage baseplate protein n=1 Tax=Lactococcus lactis TaxID=1358 RepID=UPI000A1FD7FC|nr:hypothetical protein [Lactococcus lactis]OSP88257.1 hypothetical protein B9W73_02680 [Lactococcus lactis]
MTSNEKSFPWDDHNGDREYSSDEFAEFFSTLFKPGVVATANFGTGLQITESASLGMRVKFGSGEAFSSFGRNYVHDKDEEVTVPIASTLQDRSDSVAIQFNKSQREAFFVYKESDVTVTRTDSIFELQIAKILVPKNSTQITNANITDMRANESVCGYFSPHGKLNTGDITAQFTAWFESFKGKLGTDPATNLQLQVDSLKTETDSILSRVYPVGAYYFSSQSTEPATLFGFGTWSRVKGRGLVGVDELDSALSSGGKQGGSINPLSQHTIAPSSGQFVVARGVGNQHWSSGGAPSNSYAMDTEQSGITVGDNTNHNNWQPFEAAYIWKRTA